MYSKGERKKRRIEYSLYIACLLSNMSQLPYFVRNGYTQLLAFPGWIMVLSAIVLSRRLLFKSSVLLPIGLSTLLLCWLLIDSLLISRNQFSSSMVYAYFISIFVFLVGVGAAENVDDITINKMTFVFLISTLVVSISIFIQYFGIDYNLATKIYAYGSKNSISQIIFTAFVLLIVRFQPVKLIWKVLKLIAIVFLLYVILLLRSRATLVSLILVIIVIVFSKNQNNRVRVVIALSGVVGIFLILTNSSFNNFIFNNVLFAGRNASNLNELSSGRVYMINSFPEMISGNWFTGIGPTYFECFPLSAILQFGLPGGILIILISLQPLLVSFSRRNRSLNWNLLFLISLGYVVNGLFEGLTPLGPGVKCYYMWLLYGMLINRKNVT